LVDFSNFTFGVSHMELNVIFTLIVGGHNLYSRDCPPGMSVAAPWHAFWRSCPCPFSGASYNDRRWVHLRCCCGYYELSNDDSGCGTAATLRPGAAN